MIHERGPLQMTLKSLLTIRIQFLWVICKCKSNIKLIATKTVFLPIIFSYSSIKYLNISPYI